MTEPWVMPTYPKIDTYYNRGDDFSVDLTRPRRPEFTAIDRWLFTEKVDGTNIRLGFRRFPSTSIVPAVVGGGVQMEVGGRSNNAQLPKPLSEWFNKTQWMLRSQAETILFKYDIDSLIVFGEGYGPKIQKGGGNYRQDQSFIVFDVLINEVSWLNETAITEVAQTLGFTRVPDYAIGTIEDAISIVTNPKMPSNVAADNGMPVDFEIEGVVARPLAPLYDNRGRRVMWKLKGSDFRAGKR